MEHHGGAQVISSDEYIIIIIIIIIFMGIASARARVCAIATDKPAASRTVTATLKT